MMGTKRRQSQPPPEPAKSEKAARAGYQYRVPERLADLLTLAALLEGKKLSELIKSILTEELQRRNMLLTPYDDDELLRQLGKLAPAHPDLADVFRLVGAIQ